MYADLLRYYGVDLLGVVADPPEISPKRATALIRNLPTESRTAAILRKSENSAGWDHTAYLLASVIDAVRENTFVNMQVRTKKRIEPFDKVPVPGVEKTKKKSTNKFVQMAQQQWAIATRS